MQLQAELAKRAMNVCVEWHQEISAELQQVNTKRCSASLIVIVLSLSLRETVISELSLEY
jgi:hypothetical protein